MSLYLWLDLGSLIVPFLFSFHPRIRFDQLWYAVFPGILISGLIYLAWDIPFTHLGYWGFNPDYLSGIYLLRLPLEEWLFFFCIPYACLFTHYTLVKLMPGLKLSEKISNHAAILLSVLLLIVAVLNFEKAYTLINFLLTGGLLALARWKRPDILQAFFPTFLIVLVPFFLVNGVLTGSFIADEVVWYNNDENLGIRLFTIPVEDIFYAMGMLLIALWVVEGRIKIKSGGFNSSPNPHRADHT